MSYSQGDVVELDFPFQEKDGSKSRPCVVVSRHSSNNPFIVVTPVTHIPKDNSIPLNGELIEGRWRWPHNYVRTDQLYTVDQQKVISDFGKIKKATAKLLVETLDPLLRFEDDD